MGIYIQHIYPTEHTRHGSLNVPMFHITQPLGIWSIMATIRWCPIFPKWDIYQSLPELHHVLENPQAAPFPWSSTTRSLPVARLRAAAESPNALHATPRGGGTVMVATNKHGDWSRKKWGHDFHQNIASICIYYWIYFEIIQKQAHHMSLNMDTVDLTHLAVRVQKRVKGSNASKRWTLGMEKVPFLEMENRLGGGEQ